MHASYRHEVPTVRCEDGLDPHDERGSALRAGTSPAALGACATRTAAQALDARSEQRHRELWG